ncbi:hypothetical protein BJ165DRAFT_424675 [Panaeolus papilionaceus]|nr:hypothetical protein BJ165DRAFT_424675 [Panaeolus papilionaceus]
MDTDRNSSHDTHLHAHRSPGPISDPSSTIHSIPESNSNTITNPILSIDHSTNTNPSPTSKTTANTPHLTPASSTSHLTPIPAKVTPKAMFRSSIEPVDASGEWLPAVAILGQGSPAGSGENVGGSASAKQSEEGEVKDAWGVTTRTTKSGAQVTLGVPTQPQPQASTSASSSTALVPVSTPPAKPRPPLMPSMARLRPASLDLSDSYPPDISDEGEGASSSDPLNASFSAGTRNPRYSVSSNARYSLISSPPETPLDASGLGVPLPPIPPRFMNMNTSGGGGDANFASSTLGGVGPGGMGGAGGSEGAFQPPPPTLTTGPTGYPAHVPVQLQDTGASTAPWHSYHLSRDTPPAQNDGALAAATNSSTSAPQPTRSIPAETSDVPQPQPQATRQPWSYPAFQPNEYPPFSRGPRIGASYRDPWGSHAPQNRIDNAWSAPAAYGPSRHATFFAQSQPPHQAASAPIQGVRFASEPSNSRQAEVIQTGYEANDPFKRHTKPIQPTDDLTFDDIPVPGKHEPPHSWHLYERPVPMGQQPPTSSANNAHAPTTYGPPTSRPSQPQPQEGPLEPPTRPWSYPTYSSSQPAGSAPPQNQPQPPLTGSASGSGPYLPIHSHNGSYQSYPYYPPHPASPAFGTWKKPPLWRRILSPFKSANKEDGDTQYDVLLPSNAGQGPVHMTSPYATATASWSSATTALQFVFLTIPSQVYLSLLLRLPSLYFSRVARIFEEADLTLSELKKMALEIGAERAGASRKTDGEISTRMQQMGLLDGFNAQGVGMEGAPKIPVAYERLKTTWEGFIDSVLREWKTFNIISVLLLS